MPTFWYEVHKEREANAQSGHGQWPQEGGRGRCSSINVEGGLSSPLSFYTFTTNDYRLQYANLDSKLEASLLLASLSLIPRTKKSP